MSYPNQDTLAGMRKLIQYKLDIIGTIIDYKMKGDFRFSL